MPRVSLQNLCVYTRQVCSVRVMCVLSMWCLYVCREDGLRFFSSSLTLPAVPPPHARASAVSHKHSVDANYTSLHEHRHLVEVEILNDLACAACDDACAVVAEEGGTCVCMYVCISVCRYVCGIAFGAVCVCLCVCGIVCCVSLCAVCVCIVFPVCVV